jgi:hypothetical protein
MTSADQTWDKSPLFQPALFAEAALLLRRVTTTTFCDHAVQILNSPDPNELLPIAAGIRDLARSDLLFIAEPHGTMGSMLLYMVSLCEGVIMPQLQILIELCAQEGHKGAIDRRGRFFELDQARSKFGPAIKFLATHGGAVLTAAPTLFSYLQRFDSDHLSAFRNAAAHARFKTVTVGIDVNDDATYAALSRSQRESATAILERTFKFLGLRGGATLPMIPDRDNSGVRYEEKLGKPITQASRFRSLKEVRALMQDLEHFGFSMLFAWLETGTALQKAGTIKMGAHSCGEGTFAVPAPTATTTCPACGATIVL